MRCGISRGVPQLSVGTAYGSLNVILSVLHYRGAPSAHDVFTVSITGFLPGPVAWCELVTVACSKRGKSNGL